MGTGACYPSSPEQFPEIACRGFTDLNFSNNRFYFKKGTRFTGVFLRILCTFATAHLSTQFTKDTYHQSLGTIGCLRAFPCAATTLFPRKRPQPFTLWSYSILVPTCDFPYSFTGIPPRQHCKASLTFIMLHVYSALGYPAQTRIGQSFKIISPIPPNLPTYVLKNSYAKSYMIRSTCRLDSDADLDFRIVREQR